MCSLYLLKIHMYMYSTTCTCMYTHLPSRPGCVLWVGVTFHLELKFKAKEIAFYSCTRQVPILTWMQSSPCDLGVCNSFLSEPKLLSPSQFAPFQVGTLGPSQMYPRIPKASTQIFISQLYMYIHVHVGKLMKEEQLPKAEIFLHGYKIESRYKAWLQC